MVDFEKLLEKERNPEYQRLKLKGHTFRYPCEECGGGLCEVS